MATAIDPELKMQAEEEAARKTDLEHQRIDYYRNLRFDFSISTVDGWLNSIYEKNKMIYYPKRAPSWNEIRKDAGISLWQNLKSRFSENGKRQIKEQKEESRKKLQAGVDAQNRYQWNRCKHNLVEGRISNLYLSAEVSQAIDDEVGYIKNKAFDDQYYKDLIVKYLKQYGKAKKKDIRNLLWDKLPDILSDKQKEYKIGNLLASLKNQRIIYSDSSNQQKASWILK